MQGLWRNMGGGATTVNLQDIVKRFRILHDWDIQRSRGEKYRGQATIVPKRNVARIHPLGKSSPEPADYRLHEVLHCAFRALRRIKQRPIMPYATAEEELIQDVCSFVVPCESCSTCKGTGRLIGKGYAVRGVRCECPKCGGSGVKA